MRNHPVTKTALPRLLLPLQPFALRYLITDAHGNVTIQMGPDKPQDAYQKPPAQAFAQPEHPK